MSLGTNFRLNPNERTWILSDTKLATNRLKSEFTTSCAPQANESQADWSNGFVSFFTFSEAYRRLHRELSQSSSTRVDLTSKKVLSLREKELFLYNFALSSKEKYPLIFEEIQHSFTAPHLIPNFITQIRKFLDTIRVKEIEDFIINKILDEHGNILPEKSLIEEILLFGNALVESERNSIGFDQITLLEDLKHLLSLLSADSLKNNSSLQEAKLPKKIILNQPSILTQLEQSIWLRLSKLVQISCYLSPESTTGFIASTPSYYRETAQFLENLKPVEIYSLPTKEERIKLIDKLFVHSQEEIQFEKKSEVILWENENIEAEVERTTRYISSLLAGGFSPEELQIVVLEMDYYYDALIKAFHNHGIGLSIVKGRRLLSSQSAQVFLLFLSLLEAPSFHRLLLYYQNPLVISAPLIKDEISNFLSCNKNIILSNGGENPLESIAQSQPNFSRLAEIATKKIPHNRSSSLKSVSDLLSQKPLSAEVLNALCVLSRMERFAVEIASSSDPKECLRKVRQQFLLERVNFSKRQFTPANTILEQNTLDQSVREPQQFKSQTSRSDAIYLARSVRELRRVCRHLERELDLASKNELKFEQTFKMVSHTLRTELEKSYLTDRSSPNSIVASELLDIRGISPQQTIVLGFNESTFPRLRQELGSFGIELEELTKLAAFAKGESFSIFESLDLFRHLILGNGSVVISYSRVNAQGEVSSSWIFERLKSILGLESNLYLESGAKVEGRKEVMVKACGSNPTLQLLMQRGGSSFTAYDGNIGSEGFRLVQELRPSLFRSDGTNAYSVSDLEVLGDCPHHFFFAKILGLKAREEYSRRIFSQIGIITHSALEKFFNPQGDSLALARGLALSEETFFQASLKLRAIAEELFKSNDLIWEAEPAANQFRLSIMRGLDERGDQKKRGILKGALFFQKELIKDLPLFVEYSFGVKNVSNPGLNINGTNQSVIVSGIIDRVDGHYDDELSRLVISALWDYKTGKVALPSEVLSGRSLQIPLYSLVVAQNITDGSLPIRGGCVSLSQCNRRDEDIASPFKGVLVEHLSISKNGSRYVFDQGAREVVAQKARDRVLELDRLVRSGTMHQVAETKNCPRCDFQKICFRDEVLLEQKNSGLVRKNDKLSFNFQNLDQGCFDGEPSSSEKKDLLSREQRAAVYSPKSVSLSAGAGSGKTKVLESRVIYLILKGIPAESILAITFTEKAATELSLRIETGISNALFTNQFDGRILSQQECSRLFNARFALSQSHIGTIHSFAAKILKMDLSLSGLNSGASVISGLKQSELLNECVENVLLNVYLGNSTFKEQNRYLSALQFLLDNGIYYSKLVTEIVRLISQPQILLAVKSTFHIEETESSTQGKSQLLAIIKELRASSLAALRHDLINVIPIWVTDTSDWFEKEVLKLNSEQKEHFLYALQLAKTLSEKLRSNSEEFIELTVQLSKYLSDHAKKAQKGKSKNNPRNFWKELRDYLVSRELKRFKPDLNHEEISCKMAEDFCLLSSLAFEEYQKQKMAKNYLDFNDMLTIGRKMLCGDLPRSQKGRQLRLLRRLQKRFSHILVDEFQDTDPTQWEMIHKIFHQENIKSRELEISEELAERTLFIVGDSKQAIYGFRGGDSRVFKQAQDYIVQIGGGALSLVDNYRSNKKIVNFVNKFFDELFLTDFDKLTLDPKIHSAVMPQAMNSKRDLDSSNENDSRNRIFYLRKAKIGEEEDQEIIQDLSEAQQVALYIQQVLEDLSLKGSNSQWSELLKGKPGRPRIAVLTRTVRELMRVANSLRALSIPFYLSHNHGFYELEEIAQFENLFSALHDINDDDINDELAIIGVLRSALIALSDKELVELALCLRNKNGEIDWKELFSTNKNNGRSRSYFDKFPRLKFLSRWRELYAVLPASSFITKVAEDADLESAYLAFEKPERFANIKRLRERVLVAEVDGEISGFEPSALSWLRKQKFESTNPPNANSSDSPVVLMTIHASKGLEFPMVIVPFLANPKYRARDFSIGKISSDSSQEQTFLSIRVEDEKQSFRRSKTLFDSVIEGSENIERASEERRIFYVACTRAAEYLILSFRPTQKNLDEMTDEAEGSELEREQETFTSDRPSIWLKNLLILLEEENRATLKLRTNHSALEITVI